MNIMLKSWSSKISLHHIAFTFLLAALASDTEALKKKSGGGIMKPESFLSQFNVQSSN